ncbi:MAG: YkgJ family cysteine cluster protein [Promethearchaeota archaeon]|nr:MAG: YkgJ family cysteine cluster protein [Candidatus Lokiarchaeota archaeon]
MSEEENQNQNSDEKETSKEINQEEKEEKKSRFTFKCTRCDACCKERGPIPITLWDLELWARNGVLANFLPYLEVYTRPNGTVDLILKPLLSEKEEKTEESPEEALKKTPLEDLLNEKCPLYNKEQEKCLVYENRPLSCRTYPLDYDGTHFSIVDVDCPGVGQEGMTKEELKEMRDTAKQMNYELTRIRIALPVLNQIISRNVMMDLMRQNMEAMSKMSDEDRQKLEEIFKGAQEEQ